MGKFDFGGFADNLFSKTDNFTNKINDFSGKLSNSMNNISGSIGGLSNSWNMLKNSGQNFSNSWNNTDPLQSTNNTMYVDQNKDDLIKKYGLFGGIAIGALIMLKFLKII